jgi:hypothetical protein
MLDYVLLARARKMLTDEATSLHRKARTLDDWRVVTSLYKPNEPDPIQLIVPAEACQYAADSLHNVLSKADAFLDDEHAREALRHE